MHGFPPIFRKACTCSSSWTSDSAKHLEMVYTDNRNADKKERGFATKCWTEKYAVIPSKCWKAKGNGISNKNKTKEKMYNVWLQSHKMWWSSGELKQSLPRVRCSGPCPDGFQVPPMMEVPPPLWHFLMNLSCTALDVAVSTFICSTWTFIIQHWMFTEVHYF